MALSVAYGSRDVGLDDILAAVGGSTDGFDHGAVARRIPRTWLAVIAGAGLAVSGAVMQGVTRNPLADPGILGVTTGASHRSEEHTSELQSRGHLVCRLLLEK